MISLLVLLLLGQVDASAEHPVLMAAAREHALYQAGACHQGHQRWEQRVARLQRQMPRCEFAEICAESWPEQDGQSQAALQAEMFRCWRQSPGHWSVARRRHKYFGGALARGRNGIWYACIIVAD